MPEPDIDDWWRDVRAEEQHHAAHRTDIKNAAGDRLYYAVCGKCESECSYDMLCYDSGVKFWQWKLTAFIHWDLERKPHCYFHDATVLVEQPTSWRLKAVLSTMNYRQETHLEPMT